MKKSVEKYDFLNDQHGVCSVLSGKARIVTATLTVEAKHLGPASPTNSDDVNVGRITAVKIFRYEDRSTLFIEGDNGIFECDIDGGLDVSPSSTSIDAINAQELSIEIKAAMNGCVKKLLDLCRDERIPKDVAWFQHQRGHVEKSITQYAASVMFKLQNMIDEPEEDVEYGGYKYD